MSVCAVLAARASSALGRKYFNLNHAESTITKTATGSTGERKGGREKDRGQPGRARYKRQLNALLN